MWLYIIVLAVIIGGIWLFFFQKQVAQSLDQKLEAKGGRKTLGEIFGQFKESISAGINNFKEIKNSFPSSLPASMTEPQSTSANENLNASTATENLVK